MHKMVNRFPVLLSLVTTLMMGSFVIVGCSSAAAGHKATATTDSAYSDVPIAQLIDITTHRLIKAIEFTRLLNHNIRVTGEIGTISVGSEPSSWQVSIVDPEDPNSGSVMIEMADTAFETLVDPGNTDGLKSGRTITVEGEFTGVDQNQNAAIFVHNILFNDTTYHRSQ